MQDASSLTHVVTEPLNKTAPLLYPNINKITLTLYLNINLFFAARKPDLSLKNKMVPNLFYAVWFHETSICRWGYLALKDSRAKLRVDLCI